MGDRALVVFHDANEYSPTIYLHWSGSAVPKLLADWWEVMKGRRDVSYGSARFVGLCHLHIEGPLSLGMWNTGKVPAKGITAYWKEQSHGDAGVFVVDVTTGKVQAYGGYGKRIDLAKTPQEATPDA